MIADTPAFHLGCLASPASHPESPTFRFQPSLLKATQRSEDVQAALLVARPKVGALIHLVELVCCGAKHLSTVTGELMWSASLEQALKLFLVFPHYI